MANRIKQEALAAMVGVSHAAVSQWENGHARPSQKMALRLADVVAGAREGRLAAEIAFLAPQRQIKALTRGVNLELVGVSAGYKEFWPDMAHFIGQDMRPHLMNEALLYAEDSAYLREAVRGEVLMLTCVSNRLLEIGGEVPQSFRFRWHAMVRRIDGELVHEIVFEPCDDATPNGFERVLRRSDIQSNHD